MSASPHGDATLGLRDQEIPLDSPHSRFRFDKPFNATSGALETFGTEVVYTCLRELREAAERNDGMDNVQISDTPEGQPDLWFIEDGSFVTALLPSEY